MSGWRPRGSVVRGGGGAGVAGLASELAAIPKATEGLSGAIASLDAFTLEGLRAAVAGLRTELQGAATDAQNLSAALAAADAGDGAA